MLKLIADGRDRLLTPSRRALLVDLSLLGLRLWYGVYMMLGHGLGKLQNYSQAHDKFPDPLHVGHSLSMALAIFGEFGCSALLILGLATRFAALNLAFTMGVAGFVVCAQLPWVAGPGQGSKEAALMYFLPYVVLLLNGGGRFSLDRLLFGRPAASH